MQELKYKTLPSKDCLPRDWSRLEISSMQGSKVARKNVYAGVQGGSQDCLSREILQYFYLKVLLEAIFSKMSRTNKNVFIFSQGSWTMNVLYPSLSQSFVAFAAGIQWKLNPGLFLQEYVQPRYIAGWKHDGSLEDNYCIRFFKLKFLIPT